MRKQKALLCFFAAVCSVAVLQFFIIPVYSSDDDVLYMLTLSGGFGKAPSWLLHVLQGWHPLFGGLVKWLFSISPGINWYTVFLLFFQALGLAAILYFLLHRFGGRATLVLYPVLVALFVLPFLQSPDFTGSALMGALGGCLLMCLGKKNRRALYWGGALLLCALLLRLFISTFVVLSFLPLFFLATQTKKRIAFSLAAVAASWFVLHSVQREIYIRNIPGWKEQAAFRDAFFTMINYGSRPEKHAVLLGGQPEADLLQAGFLYDTTLYNTVTLKKLMEQPKETRHLFAPEQRDTLYWTFVNNRIYISFLFFTALLLFVLNRNRFFRRAPYLLLPFAIWLFLFFFLKGTTAVLLTLFLASFFYLGDGFQKEDFERPRWFLPWYAAVCTLLLLGWSTKLAATRNAEARQRLQQFSCLSTLLQENKEQLFLASDYSVAIKYLPAWTSPTTYRLGNLLYYQRGLLQTPAAILREHRITPIFPDLLFDPNLRLLGSLPQALPDYCFKRYGLRIKAIADTTTSCATVHRVLRADGEED